MNRKQVVEFASGLCKDNYLLRLNLTNSGKNPVANCHNFRDKSQNIKLSASNVDVNAAITAGMEQLSESDNLLQDFYRC